MRRLILMRGLPGCGKSTLLKDLNLENYVISADKIRLLYSAPTATIDGRMAISQKVNSDTWSTLFNIVERRMINGDLTIVDATHTTRQSINRYKNLALKYRYKTFVVDMSDVDVNVCKERNASRDSLSFVPEFVIDSMSEQLKEGIPSFANVVSVDEFKDLENGPLTFNPIDLSSYKKVHHIGDIHGCLTVLEKFLSEGLKKDEAYIFCGDYIDRGTRNIETLKFIMSIADEPNVFLVEGNHEQHLFNWASDLPTNGKDFNDKTVYELEASDITKKDVRKFTRKLLQCAYYTYDDKTVVVTHGGISVKPSVFISTSQYIKGVSGYPDSTIVDNTFCRKYSSENCYSIHGHRNINEDDVDVNDNVFNLEDKVEFGGNLRVVTISHTEIKTEKIQNDDFAIPECGEIDIIPLNDVGRAIDILRASAFIKEKNMKNSNISSFNFSREAFMIGRWTNSTIKARGLFINTKTQEIVARGYEKFFKVEERHDTSLEVLKEKFKFPLHAYEKENGYLGILGYDSETDNLVIASKSTTSGEYAEYFKEMFYDTVSDVRKIKEFLKENNCSMVFEVIDPEHDPHIIEYKDKKLVLLDIIDRKLDFVSYPFSKLSTIASDFGFECKKLAFTINSWEDFLNFHNTVTAKGYRDDNPIEGYVIEDSNGFMVKEKTYYYNFWKFMRGLSRKIISTHIYKTKQTDTEDVKNFAHWLLKNCNKFDIEESIIKIRNAYELEK